MGTSCTRCGQPLGSHSTDKLTGLLDRWAWEQAAAETLDQAGTAPSVLLMLDLDRFAEVNDAHGHLAGDAVLRSVASLITGVVRKKDIVGRGGDEFLVLLPATGLTRAETVAERILTQLRAATISAPSARVGVTTITGLTASAGLAVRGRDLLTLFQGADEVLQNAKKVGDQIEVTAVQPSDVSPIWRTRRPALGEFRHLNQLASRWLHGEPDPLLGDEARLEQLRTLLHVLPREDDLDVLAALAKQPLAHQDLVSAVRRRRPADAPDIPASVEQALRELEKNHLVTHDRHEPDCHMLTPAARELLDRLLPAVDWVGRCASAGGIRGVGA